MFKKWMTTLRALYDLKLDAMTAQLKDAVEKSTSMILLRV